MSVNTPTKNAIRSYLRMERPGYAILIASPWGSGKTHFIRDICASHENPQDIRYVSLNGVSNEHGFRRALLKGSLEQSLATKGEIFGNLFSRRAGLGDIGSLARDVIEERLLKSLPGTLIFDDLERTTICKTSLLGLINEFIEHQRKRVILVANSTECLAIGEKKEKIIGRTLRVWADFDSAYPSFISEISDSKGKKYLSENHNFVHEVFNQTGHENLRLLRNSVRDVCLIIDQLSDEILEAKEPTERFVRTYIAISMALAKGEIDNCDIERRVNVQIAASRVNDEALKPLNGLYRRHRGADIVAHSGAVVPQRLGHMLFVEGHADKDSLNALLIGTGQFETQDENPVWKRIIHWSYNGWDDIAPLVYEGLAYLFERLPIEPGPFLHIADTILRIHALDGLDGSEEDLTLRIKERILELERHGDIPAAKFGTDFGWGISADRFSYGGYSCQPSNSFREVIDTMRESQISAYNSTIDMEAEKLCRCFERDIKEFYLMISYQSSGKTLYDVPFLHHLNMDRFVEATLRYLKQGFVSEMGDVFKKIAERHRSDETWNLERQWLLRVRRKIEVAAREHSSLAVAHLNDFFAYHWKIDDSLMNGDG